MAYHIERYVEQGPLWCQNGGKCRIEPTWGAIDSWWVMPVGKPHAIQCIGQSARQTHEIVAVSTVDGFQFISGGDVMIGGDSEAPNGLEPTTVTLQPYWIATFPVTVGDYLEFLNALALDDPAKARSHAPRSPAGTCYIDLDADTGQFVVPTEDTDGDAWDLKWPIMMVNQHDALAY